MPLSAVRSRASRPAQNLRTTAAWCLVGLTIFASGAHALAAEVDTPPNIVFIMADDLGYGDLGCYGQTRIQTPNIDRLATEGLKFTDYYAGSCVCAPSRYVLMSGIHTGHGYIRGNSKMSLRVGDVTIAEVLKRAGYKTGIFGKWGLGQENSGGLPTVQGFDTFYGFLDQHHAHNYFPAFLIRNTRREPLTNVVPGEGDYGVGVATGKKEYAPDLIWAEALQFIERSKDAPFFLYLPVTLPHANNQAGEAGMEIPDYGRYASEDWPDPQKGLAAMISRLDTDIGLLLDLLAQHGLDEKTIVFFTSDNGPHAEGGNDPEFFDSNGPLRGRKRDLYEGGIRVPLLVRWPGRIAPGTETKLLSFHGDMLQTIADLAHAPRIPAGLDGTSLVPTLLPGERRQAIHNFLYWEFYEKGFKQAARYGNWKGVRFDKDNTRVELYDLEHDLAEAHDVAADHPDIVETINGIMDAAHVPSPDWPQDPDRQTRTPPRPANK